MRALRIRSPGLSPRNDQSRSVTKASSWSCPRHSPIVFNSAFLPVHEAAKLANRFEPHLGVANIRNDFADSGETFVCPLPGFSFHFAANQPQRRSRFLQVLPRFVDGRIFPILFRPARAN